jgi:hypothetical protein
MIVLSRAIQKTDRQSAMVIRVRRRPLGYSSSGGGLATTPSAVTASSFSRTLISPFSNAPRSFDAALVSVGSTLLDTEFTEEVGDPTMAPVSTPSFGVDGFSTVDMISRYLKLKEGLDVQDVFERKGMRLENPQELTVILKFSLDAVKRETT